MNATAEEPITVRVVNDLGLHMRAYSFIYRTFVEWKRTIGHEKKPDVVLEAKGKRADPGDILSMSDNLLVEKDGTVSRLDRFGRTAIRIGEHSPDRRHADENTQPEIPRTGSDDRRSVVSF